MSGKLGMGLPLGALAACVIALLGCQMGGDFDFDLSSGGGGSFSIWGGGGGIQLGECETHEQCGPGMCCGGLFGQCLEPIEAGPGETLCSHLPTTGEVNYCFCSRSENGCPGAFVTAPYGAGCPDAGYTRCSVHCDLALCLCETPDAGLWPEDAGITVASCPTDWTSLCPD